MDAPAMTALPLVAAFVLGAALGAAHFLSLWGSVALIRQGRTGLGVGLQLLRLALIALALVAIARQGANLFLAAAAGVIVVRFALTSYFRGLA
jgi:F1F0 ATPase subunit 2